MKKLCCLLLVAVMAIAVIVGCENTAPSDETSSSPAVENASSVEDNDAAPTAPEGFSTYQNKDISLIYPSDWTQTADGSFTSTDNTKSITLTTEENSYAGLDTQKYVQKVRPELEAEGKKLVTARVAQKTVNGISVADILQTFSTEGQEGETYQNIYALTVNGKTYVITLSQPNGLEVDKSLGDKILNSITAK